MQIKNKFLKIYHSDCNYVNFTVIVHSEPKILQVNRSKKWSQTPVPPCTLQHEASMTNPYSRHLVDYQTFQDTPCRYGIVQFNVPLDTHFGDDFTSQMITALKDDG